MAGKLTGAAAVASSLFCFCALSLFAFFLAGHAVAAAAAADGFESTVFGLVEEANKGNSTVEGDPRVGPALIRLLFHDCWVHGCDGSVLLDETPGDGTDTEKKAAKSIGLGGFDLIDKIKARLIDTGDDDASCADILAFAARDAASIHRGRRDGVVSSATAADVALPGHSFSFAELASNFAARGFGKADLVALSGAHAVGVCHRPSFADRLRPSAAAAHQINGTYQLALRRELLRTTRMTSDDHTTARSNIRDMGRAFRAASRYSPMGVDTAATGTLDNSYYTANLQNMVLLKSDWELTQDDDALDRLVEYRDDAAKWSSDFGAAMERLSNLRPPAGSHLEIRKNCRITNLSPGRAVLYAVYNFLHRRYRRISYLLDLFDMG